MTTEEFDSALSELETRVDRLRALYENWFRGYEKSEPSVARKDVERRVYALRKELPRNTALRFRYHQLYLRFTTLATYWQRTARQIEDGTHKLQLQRMRRRNQRPGPREPGDEQVDKPEDAGPRHYELDLDESLNVDDLLDDLEIEEVARALDAPGPHSEPPPAARPAPVARSFARHKRDESLPSLPPVALEDADFPAARSGPGARRPPAAGASDFPDFAEPPTAVRHQPGELFPRTSGKPAIPAPGEARPRDARRDLPPPPQPSSAVAPELARRAGAQPVPSLSQTGHAAGAQGRAPPGPSARDANRAGPSPSGLGAGPPAPPPTMLGDKGRQPLAAGPQPPRIAAPPAGGAAFPTTPPSGGAAGHAPAAPSGTGAGRPLPAEPSTPGAGRPALAGPSMPGAGRPAPAGPSIPGAGRPAPAEPSMPGAGRPAPAGPSMPGAGRPAPAGPSMPGAGRPAPGAPSATAAGWPAPAGPSATAAGWPAPAGPSAAAGGGNAGAPSATAAGRPAPGAAPTGRSAPGATAPGGAAPRTTSATAAGRPAPGAPSATGVGRSAAGPGAAAPAAPSATRPGVPGPGGHQVPVVSGNTIVGRPPLSSPLSPSSSSAPNDQRMRRIYDEYAAARRRNNEGEVRYEVMVNSIQKMLPELAKKHQGRPIDFEVVVKDGRVGLKPKAT